MSKKWELPDAIGRLLSAPDLSALTKTLADDRIATAFGLWGSSAAAVAASVQRQLDRPLLFVCGHLDEADDVADDIELFSGVRPAVLPSLEIAGNLGRVSEEQASERMRLVLDIAAGKPPRGIVAPIQALMQPVPARDELKHLAYTVKKDETLEIEKLIVWLSEHGFNRVEQCEVPGDFAVRGGIVDAYLPGTFDENAEEVGLTVRIDFFGDNVESIRRFDIDTLGSGDVLAEVRFVDIKGQMAATSGQTHLFAYLDESTLVVLNQSLEIQEQARSYIDRVPDQRGIYPLNALLRHAAEFTLLELSEFDQGLSSAPSLVRDKEPPRRQLPIRSLQKFETEAKKAIHELAELSSTHDVVVFCENDGERKRFTDLLDAELPGLSKKVPLPVGYLHR
ncbi:MAG TPA: hypothetical protein VGB55_12665, partial [Tepidisphaeraceae bacterium]